MTLQKLTYLQNILIMRWKTLESKFDIWHNFFDIDLT